MHKLWKGSECEQGWGRVLRERERWKGELISAIIPHLPTLSYLTGPVGVTDKNNVQKDQQKLEQPNIRWRRQREKAIS